jgi:hypothetical protein
VIDDNFAFFPTTSGTAATAGAVFTWRTNAVGVDDLDDAPTNIFCLFCAALEELGRTLLLPILDQKNSKNLRHQGLALRIGDWWL